MSSNAADALRRRVPDVLLVVPLVVAATRSEKCGNVEQRLSYNGARARWRRQRRIVMYAKSMMDVVSPTHRWIPTRRPQGALQGKKD